MAQVQNAFYNSINGKYYIEISRKEFETIQMNSKQEDPVLVLNEADLTALGIPSLVECRRQLNLNSVTKQTVEPKPDGIADMQENSDGLGIPSLDEVRRTIGTKR